VLSQKFTDVSENPVTSICKVEALEMDETCVMHSYGGYGGVCVLVAIADDHSVVGNFS